MPREIFEPATTPKGILGWRLRKLLQNAAHESPAFQVGQLSEVTEHAGEVRPDERIDPRDIRAAEAKVDPCWRRLRVPRPHCRGRKRRRRARRRAFPQAGRNLCRRPNGHNAPSGRSATRAGGARQPPLPSKPVARTIFRACTRSIRPRRRRWARRRSPAGSIDVTSISFSTGSSRTSRYQSRYSRHTFGEILSMRSHARRPNFASYQARGVRLGMPKSMPVTSLEVRSSCHAGKSAPRPLEPTGIAIHDPDIGYPLELQAERGRKSALAAANDQHIEDPGAVPIARDRPLPREDSSDTSARAAPDPRAGQRSWSASPPNNVANCGHA